MEPVVAGAFVQLILNGQSRRARQGSTIADLIEELGLGAARIAVEHNRRIVPSTERATTRLAEGDRLELVTFVGGG